MLCIRGTSHGPVSVCVCVRLSQVGVLPKRVNEPSFWHVSFLLPVLHCVKRKFDYLQKLGHFPLELCPKLWTLKISPRHIDRRNAQSVINWAVVGQLS